MISRFYIAFFRLFFVMLLLIPASVPAESQRLQTASNNQSPFGQAAAAQQDQDQQSSSPTFRVDVKLVNVFVTVQDQNGAPVSNLQKNNFNLFEDGIPQKIAVFDRESEMPLSIVVAVDSSLSTKKDLPLELESARRFVRSILRPIDALSLYQFSDTVDEVVPFTSDLKRIDRGIKRIRVGSATALYDALYLSSEALEKRQGRKVIVVITDGGDTVSQVNYREALRAAEQAEAILYSIIIVPVQNDPGRDVGGEHALITLSRETGGKYFYADTTHGLDQAFEQISEELRTQYLLAYYPSRRFADSDFRRIQVNIVGTSEDGLIARHRAGYYTSKLQ